MVGFATSKKIGSQPRRNRIKRRFREALRAQVDLVDPKLDYVLVILPKAEEVSPATIASELNAIFSGMRERWENRSASS
jgi:ribonuclease P protein component